MIEIPSGNLSQVQIQLKRKHNYFHHCDRYDFQCDWRKVFASLHNTNYLKKKKSKPLSLFRPLICSTGVWKGWLVPLLLYAICCLPYEKHNPLKFILQLKPRQLIDTQTKLRELQSAALIDGRTWKVACLFPLCDYSIKPRPVWLAGINMHGDSLSPLFSASVWSDTVCLFFFVCQGAIHLSTSEHCRRVASCTSFSSVSPTVGKESPRKVSVARFPSAACVFNLPLHHLISIYVDQKAVQH